MIRRLIWKHTFIFLTFLGVFSTYPKAVYQARAEEPVGDIIYISTPQEFQDINLDLTAHYEIVNDIDFTDFKFEPIAKNDFFTGVINGNNYVLSNLKLFMSPENYLLYLDEYTISYSIIVNNNGKIKNITFHDISIDNYDTNTFLFNFSGTKLNLNISYLITFNWLQGEINNVTIIAGKSEVYLITSNGRLDLINQTNYIFHVNFSTMVNYNFGLIHFVKIYTRHSTNISVAWGRRDVEIKLAIVNFNYGTVSSLKSSRMGNELIIIAENRDNYSNLQQKSTIYYSNLLNFNLGVVNNMILTRKNTTEVIFEGILPVLFYSEIVNDDNGGSIFNVNLNGEKRLRVIHESSTAPSYYSAILNISEFSNSLNNSSVFDVNIDLYSVITLNLLRSDIYYYVKLSVFGLLGADFSNIENIILHGDSGFEFNHSTNAKFELIKYTVFEEIQNARINYIAYQKNVDIYYLKDSNYGLKLVSNILIYYFFPNNLNNFVDVSNIFFNQDTLYFFYRNPYYPTSYFGTSYLGSSGYYYFLSTYFPLTINSIFEIELVDLLFYLSSTFESWSYAQLSNRGEPTLTFSQFNIDLIHGMKYNLFHSFLVKDFSLNIDGKNFEDGTHYLTEIGKYNVELFDEFIERFLSITIDITNNNLFDGGTYEPEFVPDIVITGGNSLLNGQPYTVGTPITNPGTHTLVVFGENGYKEEITFNIILETSGFTNGSTYENEAKTITFSGGTATLNGDPFVSGTEVSEVGNYELIITGVNGFEERFTFTIKPEVGVISDNSQHDGFVTPTIEGEGMTITLNGQPYTVGERITNPGTNTLVITSDNGDYRKEYTFTINLITSGFTNGSTYENEAKTITFSGGTATLNGDPFVSGTEVSEVGNYELIITGVNGFEERFTFTIKPEVGVISDNSQHDGFVTPTIEGEGMTITLNGQPYTVGERITNPGTNTLVITSDNGDYRKEYTFTINLITSGFTNGSTYENEAKTITFSGGTATLNGDPFVSGTEVSEVGNYELIITGVNGFEERFTFTIKPEVGVISDNSQHDGFVTPTIEGEGMTITLNGQPYTVGTPITNPGTHTLVVFGENGYKEEITFNIILETSGFTNGSTYENEAKTITFSGGTATLNGDPFVSGTEVSEVGNYELIITGVNGFEERFTFTIKPEVGVISDNSQHDGFVTPTIEGEGMTITLNGQPYTVGERITNPGTNTLVITSDNGDYRKEYTFTINLITSGFTNGSTYENEAKTITFSGGTATLNGDPFVSGTEVSEVGNYELIITGVNGFEERFTFTIKPEVGVISDNSQHDGFVTPTIEGEGMTITLNGQPYTVGERITNPGTNTLVITSDNGDYRKEYTFTINLITSGFTNGSTYENEAKTITFSGGTATLNGEPFVSGTEVSEVGNYELIITGVNGFEERFTFTIKPEVLGLEDEASYIKETNIQIFGQGMTVLMNGEPFTNTLFNQPGMHQLIIMGNGNYQLIFDFNINLVVTGVLSGASYVNSPRTINFSGGSASLNGIPIESGMIVNQVGHYQLLIPQTNMETFELNFTIMPDIKGVNQNRTYNGQITPSILGTGMALTLNDRPYQSGTLINNPGINFLKITSENGAFELIYTFTINLVFSGLSDGVTYYDVLQPTFSGGRVTLNGTLILSGFIINTLGDFEIIIEGDNDFFRSYEFKILPYQINVPSQNGSYGNYSLKITKRHSLTKIYINEELSQESKLFELVGHYDLRIMFDEQIYLEQRFTIEPQNYIQDGSVFTSPITIYYPHATVKINGKEVNRAVRVDIQKAYNVEVFGVNGYFHTYSFTFINENLEAIQQLTIPMIGTAIASLSIFFLRKRLVS